MQHSLNEESKIGGGLSQLLMFHLSVNVNLFGITRKVCS